MLVSRAAEVALAVLPLLDPKGPGPDARGRGTRELSEEARVPCPFLAKVFQRLVDRGLVRSKRGRAGGFLLGRPAKEITLADVILALDGADDLETAFPSLPGPAGRALEAPRRAFLDVLRRTSVEDLRR
jgi:Rrf2 family protein